MHPQFAQGRKRKVNGVDTKTATKKTLRKIDVLIGILAVALVASLVALAVKTWVLPREQPPEDTVQSVVEDNVIDSEQPKVSQPAESQPPVGASVPPQEEPAQGSGVTSQQSGLSDKRATTLALNGRQPEVNHPFQVTQFLPGDRVEQTYSIQVSHQVPVEVGFRVDVREQTQQLSQMLNLRVVCTTTGETVYQGTMENAQSGEYIVALPANQHGEDILDYTVEVSVDTSVDNTYQGAKLRADFHWYATDEEALTPPQTGDSSNLLLWVMAVVSAGGLFMLLKWRKGCVAQ